uniref:Uncharacterized protein n=1 Tax=Tanacetum cinerariifolium TaxID=118510 RepID=A0A699GPH5_TANCI|nr:hypothetical protein CTI12_AA123990 [Tanacetum cinerariifolium]
MSSKPEKFQLVGQTSKAMSSHSAKSQPELFLNELELGVTDFIPNKDEFRIMKNADFMLEFDSAITVHRVHTVYEGFVRYPFQLVDIDNIEPINNKFWINAVGYVTNVGRMTQQKTGSRSLDFYLATSRFLKLLIDRLYLSSTSSTLIRDDAKIPAVKQLKTDNKYRLELQVSNETAQVVVVMFDDTAKKVNTDEHLELPQPLANIIGIGHILELKSHTYYEYQNFESFMCWKIVVAEDVKETSNSPTVEPVIVGLDVLPKEPTLKSLVKSPSIATPSKPAEATKKEVEDSDAEESFAVESHPTGENAGCSSDMCKRRRQDGKVQSYCGLRLTDMAIPITGASSLPGRARSNLNTTTVPPSNYPLPQPDTRTLGERYYLRMLLNVLRGLKSFEELMTDYKRVYSIFKETWFTYGLLNDDREWTRAISETSLRVLASQLRDLFVTILLFCDVNRPLKLWEENWEDLSEDIMYRKEQIQNYYLIEIQELLNKNRRSLADFPDIPHPNPKLLTYLENCLIREALAYDINKSKIEHQKLHSLLNPEHRR